MQFRFDERGAVANILPYEITDAHQLIEECMITANVEAAKFRYGALYHFFGNRFFCDVAYQRESLTALVDNPSCVARGAFLVYVDDEDACTAGG